MPNIDARVARTPSQLQVAADHRADELGAEHLELAEVGRLEFLHQALRALLELHVRRLRDERQPDHLLVRRVAVALDDFLVAGNRVANRVLAHRLLEADHDQRAAGEVDAQRQPAHRNQADAGQDQQPREHQRMPAPPQPVDVYVRKNSHDVRC